MIKFRLRKNLLYLLIFYLSWNIRNFINIVFALKFKAPLTFIYLYLMTLAETFGGMLIYLYQNRTTTKKTDNNNKSRKVRDGIIKITLLIFFAAFFDFFEFIMNYYYVPLTGKKISPSLEGRLASIQTITSALLCTYALNFKILRHHKASLIIISICFCLTLILDIYYKFDTSSFGKIIFACLSICYYMIGFSFGNSIEKYLADTNFMNPFKILMCEGAFEIVMAIFASIGKEPFKGLIKLYKNNGVGNNVLMTFLLLIHFILSIMINAYKIYCNVNFSPMARSLVHFFMNPFSNIYYFLKQNDFNGNIFYFIISEIICVVTDFFGCVYNEYIILSCCDLETDTIDAINERSLSPTENIPLFSPDNDFNDAPNNDNNNNKKIDVYNDDDIYVGSYQVYL